MAVMLEQLQSLAEQGVITPVAYQFAAFLQRFEDAPEVLLAAAIASEALGDSHSCVDLSRYSALGEAFPGSGLATPALEAWREALLASDNVATPASNLALPLVLDGDNLYLSRCYRGERQLAQGLLARAGEIPVEDTWLGERLAHYFGAAGETPNWQKLAAAIALSRGFALVTGGPGTGKTTTVVKILALLLDREPQLTIAMAAPTGKAAARLSQSISGALQADASIEPALAARIPTAVSTIHRLLRPIPNSVRFRHNSKHPLGCDVLLLDEASMVDTELMAALMGALKPACRIILLGDRDQLPPVGTGQLIHDLCSELGPRYASQALPYSESHADRLSRLCGFELESWRRQAASGPLGDCIALLQHSYRFDPASGIGRLADLVNAGEVAGTESFIAALGDVPAADVCHIAPAAENTAWLDRLAQPWGLAQRSFEDDGMSVAEKLAVQADYQVLCAVKQGIGSVQQVNEHVEQTLAPAASRRQGYYPGKPIMVTENNYAMQLYNGDTGLVLRDEGGQLVAWFMGEEGNPRRFPISRLPAHETAYAISVHKSQGSEYRHVALVLPPVEAGNLTPLVSRELIYTGITRAREQLTLACTCEALLAGIQRRVRRDTGLSALLAEGSTAGNG